MKEKLTSLITEIVQQDALHGKWLNTLSLLENCGARKIAACEHPILVKEEMLKHAAEEFRHSHYLKRQIKKVSSSHFPNYSLPNIFGGMHSLHYLNKLDVLTSRFLIKEIGLEKQEVKKIAYLLVTYAIELRAQEFYPLYEKVLRAHHSKVYVKSIILEEEEHLNEMREGITKLSMGLEYAKQACAFEHILFNQWIHRIEAEVIAVLPSVSIFEARLPTVNSFAKKTSVLSQCTRSIKRK